MKDQMPERFRLKIPGRYETLPGDRFGMFVIPGHHAKGRELKVLVDDGKDTGWEHVSVSIMNSLKCPSWEEMVLVKDLFWRDDEAVVQFHPAKSDYVNQHPGCLHLWRPTDRQFPMPPKICV